MHHHNHDNHQESLSERQRIEKIIAHWIKHNDDHIKGYQEWAQKATKEKMAEVSDILNEIAEMSQAINEKMKTALTLCQKD